MKKTRMEKGITLIALIITIVVLLILAAVAISSITNDGILQYAQNAAKDYNQAMADEQQMLQQYVNFLNNGSTGSGSTGGEGSGSGTEGEGLGSGSGTGDESGTGGTTQTVATVKNTVLSTTANTEVYDEYGNKIVVPAGFKIRVDSTTNNADTVTEGIVIEDGTNGNQFVWIPVGKIYTDTAKTEANAKTITLGRYVFADGTTDLDGDGKVLASGEIVTSLSKTNPSDELKTSSTASNNFTEGLKNSTTENAHARDIEAFIASTNPTTGNGGYYIGRYEAGDSSNTTVANRTGTYGKTTAGTLVCKANQVPYNWILQADASSKCKSMYGDGYKTDGTGTFSSDLINSYAWDTAIVFIQTFGTKSNSSNYSRTIGKSKTSTSTPQNTGTNVLDATNSIDEQLNIYDMAGNCWELSTETYSTTTGPCPVRGGIFDNTHYTSYRQRNRHKW